MSYEVRVWCEDGTLMGVAGVTKNDSKAFPWHVSLDDVDPRSGYAWKRSSWVTQESAEFYAREWADGYAEWLRETCDCGGDSTSEDCGVLHEHGVYIQYCRDGYTIGRDFD